MNQTSRGKIRIERVWAMPSRWTFTIKPIKKLLDEEVGSGLIMNGLWCDPFAGQNSPAQVTNDIQEDADHNKDALEFLKEQPSNHFDGVLYDPPYSITQAVRRYGIKQANSQKWWADVKNEIARITKPGGKVISFGWNSMGMGKSRHFTTQRILLVPHGGSRNDTIVTVETKEPL